MFLIQWSSPLKLLHSRFVPFLLSARLLVEYSELIYLFPYRSILWTMPSYQNIISLLIVTSCWYGILVHFVFFPPSSRLSNFYNVFCPSSFSFYIFFCWIIELCVIFWLIVLYLREQKVAAVIDTLPLSLHDKYLFCIR